MPDLAEYPDTIKVIHDALFDVLDPVGAAVILGQVDDGDVMPRADNGQMRPTCILEFGTPETVTQYWRGITGASDDMSMFMFAALCASESYWDTVKLVGMVHGTLTGFRPTAGSGEIVSYGSAARAPVSWLMHPARFAQTIGFGLSIGAIVVP